MIGPPGEGSPFPEPRNPDWTRDEVILACSLVASNGWRYLSATDQRVIELSGILRSLELHPDAERSSTFRNANSVARKTADIATQHPGYIGRPTRGGKHDREVLTAFLADSAGMRAVAQSLRAEAGRSPSGREPTDPDLGEPVNEGGVLERRHLARERDPKLRANKIDAVVRSGGVVACEVCGFDFRATYGEHGEGYIEVHHRLPLHASGPIKTALADLALLCSNCHRMIHRRHLWLTVEQLAEMVVRPGAS
ncbi:MAG TPA: HNH endonuclease [Jatrophihabitantaceae bacterium]|jgi:5-methylcytosine-specific restriction protein A